MSNVFFKISYNGCILYKDVQLVTFVQLLINYLLLLLLVNFKKSIDDFKINIDISSEHYEDSRTIQTYSLTFIKRGNSIQKKRKNREYKYNLHSINT